QAEDGIRDRNVNGVQTCALPISTVPASTSGPVRSSTPAPSARSPMVTEPVRASQAAAPLIAWCPPIMSFDPPVRPGSPASPGQVGAPGVRRDDSSVRGPGVEPPGPQPLQALGQEPVELGVTAAAAHVLPAGLPRRELGGRGQADQLGAGVGLDGAF